MSWDDNDAEDGIELTEKQSQKRWEIKDRIKDLESQLAAAKDELKTGNQLYARLTDRKNDLENELAAAKAEIESLESLVEANRMAFNHRESHLESETQRLREALEKVARNPLYYNTSVNNIAQSALDGPCNHASVNRFTGICPHCGIKLSALDGANESTA